MSLELSNSEKFINWLKTKITLNSRANFASKRFVRRGQVYWCDFGINIGHEMSKTTPRPAVVIQNYIANQKSPNTIVVPITHDTSTLPCMVPISPIIDKLGKVILDGQVNTSNIVCVSKARLGDLITELPSNEMKKIDESIAKSLDLMHYYSHVNEKYDKLNTYLTTVKTERNKNQDIIKQIKYCYNETKHENILNENLREMLDSL